MRVVFLQPPFGAWVYWGKHRAINVSHAQMAACLREWMPEADIKVLDCRALDMDEEQMLETLCELGPDVIYMGDAYQMTGTLTIVPKYKRTAQLIKKRLPDVYICTGGFYIAAHYKDVLSETPEFDFTIAGEQEVTFTELCKELSKSNPDIPSVKGLVFRVNGGVEVNEYRPLIKNLDDLPMPAYDLFPMDKYIGFGTIHPYQEIFTSRGCPYGCRFCIDWVTVDPRGNNDWLRYRTKSGSRVVDEIELLEKKYGVKHVNIFDLNFNVQRPRVEEFVEERLKRGIKSTCTFLGRANSFVRDIDLLDKLCKSNVVSGVFGLEAADEKTLKIIKKRITVDQVEEVVARFREHGLMSTVTWMIGFPDDDEKMIRERFKKLDQVDPDVQALQMVLPVPGIPMYDELLPYVEETDLNKWDFHHPVVRTKYLSRKELGELALWANSEFYGKSNRIQRVLHNERLHPFCRGIFRTFMESMEGYQRAAVHDEAII
jgi:anaerobic magnesium-protoporphyrin IX monomethyl ester cyclase